MLNINAFGPVVHENFSKFPLVCPLRGMPLDLITSEFPFPRDTSCQMVEIRLVVLEKKSFKGKADARWTTDGRRTLLHAISSLGPSETDSIYLQSLQK